MRWRGRQFEMDFPRPPLLMGIVNVTPDSFSDGGQYFDPERAVAHALELVAEGADLVDIGGESTRPRALPVEEDEELRRVLPVIRGLRARSEVLISVDTRKPSVAEAALAAGANVLNDIAANREEEAMWRVVAATGAGYLCMHMQGTPETMQVAPHYKDVVEEVRSFFVDRLQRLARVGVEPDQVAFDPGFGFGKGLEHNLALLRSLSCLISLGRPVALGVSRKSFIGKLLGVEVGARLPASLACACWAVQAGVQIVRTHDVAATRQAIRMTQALQSSHGAWIG